MLARGRWHRPPPSRRGTRVIAVGSTGADAGQSTVAAHLAMAMANLGAQVIAVDLDDRAPALSRWLGVEAPRLGWRSLLDRETHTLDLALTRSPVRNLQLLGAGVARGDDAPQTEGAALDDQQRQLLVQQLRALGVDVVILDLARATHDQLRAWFALAEVGLLVTPADRPALAGALELIADLAQPPASDGTGADTGAPALGWGTRLVGNHAAHLEDVEILHAFSRLVRTELSIDLPVLGCVLSHDRLAAVAAPDHGRPGQIAFDANAQAFLRMGEILLHENLGMRAAAAAAAADDAPAATTDPSGPSPTPTVARRIDDPQQIVAAHLDLHRRKQVRVDVDWAATLVVGTRPLAVRVVDVSMSGAALEIVSPLPLGTAATLVFDQLAHQPTVAVLVKSLRPEVGRAGVAFVGGEEIRRALLAAAHDQQAPVPSEANDDEPTRPLRVPHGG